MKIVTQMFPARDSDLDSAPSSFGRASELEISLAYLNAHIIIRDCIRVLVVRIKVN